MTASAAGLVDLYSISDGTNKDITGTEDPSHTGTVTNTYTDTNSGVLKDNYAKIIGIVLDEDYVNAEVGKEKTLTATVVLDSDVNDENLRKGLENLIKWQVLNADGKIDANTNKVLSISSKTGDRTKVTLNPRKGTKKGEEMIVRATIDGNYYAVLNEETGKYEVKELVDNKAEGYKAEAKVYIKQYTDSLSWKEGIPQAYVKHTLDLNEYLQRNPETANDEITWSSSDTKVATVTAAGVVTFKKVQKENEIVTITAVSEKGATAEKKFNVGAGTPASKVEIYKKGENEIAKKIDLDLADEDSADVTVTMYAKVEAVLTADGKSYATSENDVKKNGDKFVTKKMDVPSDVPYLAPTDNSKTKAELTSKHVTDDIAWTSNKTTIATVEGGNEGATITAVGKALGTANITAKASNGKSAKVSVAVKATLTDLTIDRKNIPSVLYSGQTLQMKEIRTPEANKDGIKWSVAKVWDEAKGKYINNPNATINGKGVLTIKPKLDMSYTTVIVLLETKATKTVDGTKVPAFSDTVDITIDQSSLEGFMVYQDSVAPANLLAAFETNKQTVKNQVSKISVPKGRTYVATATPTDGYSAGAETLVWKSSSDKIATVVPNGDGTAKITAVAKGNATITVSGIRTEKKPDGTLKAAKAIKATFKVAVSQPTTSLTMNKTSVVLKDTGKKQTVSFSVKQNKNAKETINWSLDGAKDGVSIDISKGKVTLDAGKYEAGNKFTVVAKSQSGVTAKATIQIITASAGVKVVDEEGYDFSYTAAKNGKQVNNATTLGLGQSVELFPEVNVGTAKAPKWISAGTIKDGKAAANVTYSANKKGIVQIIGNTVYRVGNGSVTITVKTADGKSYKLKIDDADKAIVE